MKPSRYFNRYGQLLGERCPRAWAHLVSLEDYDAVVAYAKSLEVLLEECVNFQTDTSNEAISA